MLRLTVSALCAFGFVCSVSAANAGECPGNPNALGTSRVIAVDPAEHARLGTMQYGETLPLADKEVVLTFDDGPLPPYTNRILDALAAECVKATFFTVGRMARAYPDVLRRVYAEGHTIGTHSQNHPMIFNKMALTRVQAEVEDGIGSVAAAIGNPKGVAPFFRIPGLARSQAVETYLEDRGLMLWSADFPADDWTHIDGNEVLRRAIRRIEFKGKGILLLHDIQPATVHALPGLLRELKARGYRIVHVVPASIEHPKTATMPQDWIFEPSRRGWPRTEPTAAKAALSTPRPATAPVQPATPELRSAIKPEGTGATLESLDSTQSITFRRHKAKLHLSRPAFLPPLVLSN
jgi:peptidoglycan/xylan/chitin deacetylase (PgdA/CDA1 family)